MQILKTYAMSQHYLNLHLEVHNYNFLPLSRSKEFSIIGLLTKIMNKISFNFHVFQVLLYLSVTLKQLSLYLVFSTIFLKKKITHCRCFFPFYTSVKRTSNDDQRFPTYRNQSTDLHSKSIDWFLYDGEHWSLTG